MATIQEVVELHNRALQAREEASRYSKLRDQKIAELVAAGVKQIRIAEALGLSRARVGHMASH